MDMLFLESKDEEKDIVVVLKKLRSEILLSSTNTSPSRKI
jgi:hypothetical protein